MERLLAFAFCIAFWLAVLEIVGAIHIGWALVLAPIWLPVGFRVAVLPLLDRVFAALNRMHLR